MRSCIGDGFGGGMLKCSIRGRIQTRKTPWGQAVSRRSVSTNVGSDTRAAICEGFVSHAPGQKVAVARQRIGKTPTIKLFNRSYESNRARQITADVRDGIKAWRSHIGVVLQDGLFPATCAATSWAIRRSPMNRVEQAASRKRRPFLRVDRLSCQVRERGSNFSWPTPALTLARGWVWSGNWVMDEATPASTLKRSVDPELWKSPARPHRLVMARL